MLRHIKRALRLKNVSRSAASDAEVTQTGAIPYAWVKGEPVYLLVTSRRTKRWIFPKGMIAPGMTGPASAAKEAWEEAGITGRIEDVPVGVYMTERVRGHSRRQVAVALYPLEVDDQRSDWPERRNRKRHWATLRQARRLIDNDGLFVVLRTLDGRLTASRRDQTPRADRTR